VSTFAPTLQAFFTQHLIDHRRVSTHTVTAYRDTCKLLLAYAQRTTGIPPSKLTFTDLDAPLVSGFLDHLQRERGNSVRTRNARLAALHSLFSFAALRHPEDAANIQRVLAIPAKRFDRALVTYLTEPETHALLASPNQHTWIGRRDHTLLALACQTGLRASELTTLTHADVHLDVGAHVRCVGKGRKERITPLTAEVVAVLTAWTGEQSTTPDNPLFPTRRGTPLSRDALERRLAKYTAAATTTCASLANKKISPHTLRHTAAMRLLNAGVDTTVIALWLGHESVATTQIYVHADLAVKERALARTAPMNTTPGRYQPPDSVIAFLERL
jgi:integrase/recombinase XerD